MLAMILRWLSSTPLGSPSLPLEKRMAAGASMGILRPYSIYNQPAGNTVAQTSSQSFPKVLISPARSSR